MPRRLTNNEFITRATRVHGDRFDYANIDYKNKKHKIEIKCNTHNITFNQIPSEHLQGHVGCKQCIVNKRKNTMLEKYGVEHQMYLDSIKEKIKQTCLKRYDVENPSQLSEIKEKKKQTCLKNYNVESPLQSKEVLGKVKETCLIRYDANSPLQSIEIRKKIEQTNLEKYGSIYSTQHNIPLSILNKLNDIEWLTEQHHAKEFTLTKISEILSVNVTTVANRFHQFGIEIKYFQFSTGEKELLEFVKLLLPDETIIPNDRKIIKPYEIDIYIPMKKIAIEYNGEYWHKNKQHIDKLKEKMCNALDIKLLIIWENQWIHNNIFIKQIISDKLINGKE